MNNIDSILKLGWLPMKERREWHVLKAAHKLYTLMVGLETFGSSK